MGPIERIKLWPDPSKSGPPPTHLESIIITKKYSLSERVAEIYKERLEQISRVLYRRINGKTSHERLGSGRSILRSPSVSEKGSFPKKVTWDEQSLTSQDDSIPFEQQWRTRSMNTNEEENHAIEDQLYWLSSHNYLDQQWTIRSIEESHSFEMDSSTRSRLLSDRLTTKTAAAQSMKDEIYSFDPSHSLTKDKSMEWLLTPSVPNERKMRTEQNIPSPRLLPHSKSLHRQDSIGGLTGHSTPDSRSSPALIEAKELPRRSPSVNDNRMQPNPFARSMHRTNENLNSLRQRPLLPLSRSTEKKSIHGR